jgi:monofunctional biosynthetic peptidoglycan transglycosylase
MAYAGSAGTFLKRLIGFLLLGAIFLLLLSVAWVILYKYVNPPTTLTMMGDTLEGHSVKQTWRPLALVDVDMPRAVITAEDRDFCTHNGFDLKAIAAAMKANQEGGNLRGGSTISQQTAKNAFLWGERSYLRKGLEAWFTMLIEQIWGKRRIMEVYLNIAETGIHTYGVEEGARRYFDKGAGDLTRRQAAQIAAVLPSPQKRPGKNPSGQTRRYARNIEKWIRVVKDERLDACLGLVDR